MSVLLLFDIDDIIYLVSKLLQEAIPIGFVFGIAEWCLHTFFSFVFGKRWLRGDD